MFTTIQSQGNIVITEANFSWGPDLDQILDILSTWFDDFNGNGFAVHKDEFGLRAALRKVPTLARLAEQVRGLGSQAVVLNNLGLAGLPEATRNAALYAISLMIGYPTSTDQRTGRVAWDVKARPVVPGGNRFTTFSERVGNADMHTDSSFYPMPEEQFMLYVVNAANCDGGHSLLIDTQDIHAALQRTARGRAALALLSTTPVPFRVPAVYAAAEERVEVFCAPVFGPSGRADARFSMRWRHDSIMKGLAVRPDMDTPALRDALAVMHEAAEHGADRFQEQLQTDTLMVADNHHMLHGRMHYEDPARHLIRIRISALPNSLRTGPSGIGAD